MNDESSSNGTRQKRERIVNSIAILIGTLVIAIFVWEWREYSKRKLMERVRRDGPSLNRGFEAYFIDNNVYPVARTDDEINATYDPTNGITGPIYRIKQ